MGYTREWLESAIPGGRWQPNGEYKCAIRDERTPSCFINLEKRTYNDYGGNSGKLSDLLREMNIPDPYQGAAQAAPTPGSKSDTARRLWEKAQPATRHPYCDKKGISPDGCRVTSDGLLLVPGWNENGEVVSIERISPDGTKRHYGPKDGAFFLCGDTTEDTPLLCAEGFSTAATLHALTGWPVAASFGAANLPKTVRVLGRVFPGREIGACPDADAAGAKAGDEAALAGACVVSLPEGVPGHFDWNDCAHRHGVEIVKGMFQDQWQNRRKKEKPVEKPKITITTMTARDLRSSMIKPPTWIVPNILPQGLAVLAGRPKGGKSWLALKLALSVASGTEFLGNECKPGKVLYAALEDTPFRLKSRIGKLWDDDRTVPGDMHATTEMPKLDATGLPVLEAWVQEHRPRLVILDTWAMCKASGDCKKNAYEQDVEIVSRIKKLADDNECCILLLHHENKANGNDQNWLNSLSGSLGLPATVDTILSLKREMGADEAVLKRAGRDLTDDSDIALEWTEEGWRYQGLAKETKCGKERLLILRSLKEAGEPVSVTYISADIGKTANATRSLLFKMVKGGLVSRTSDGKYQLPQEGRFRDDDDVGTVTSVTDVNTVMPVTGVMPVMPVMQENITVEEGSVMPTVMQDKPSDSKALGGKHNDITDITLSGEEGNRYAPLLAGISSLEADDEDEPNPFMIDEEDE